MRQLADMIWVETRKAWRSRMPLFTAIGAAFLPLGIGFLLLVATNPDISRKLGLVSAKASLVTYATGGWPAYLGLLAETIAAGGFFIFCLIICWVFGREFADGTLKDMLAVPVGRGSILLAKYVVAAAWSALLTLLILAAGLSLGALIGLPQGSPAVLIHGAGVVATTACLVIVVVLPFAFFASVGRGYLLPIGVAILTLILANILGIVGWGGYFPWAIPGLHSQGSVGLVPASYPIALLTGALGMIGTYLWWKYADQNR